MNPAGRNRCPRVADASIVQQTPTHFKDTPFAPNHEARRVGSTSYIDDSLRSFLVKLGGRSPEPAGGAALALAGASAAALVSLTCHAGLGDSDLGAEHEALRACQVRSADLSERIQKLIDQDVHAYRAVLQALRMPQATDDQRRARQTSLDDALARASEVPLEVARASLEILALAVRLEPSVRPVVVGDLAASVHLAEAAIRGSLRNARVNAGAMVDASRAQTIIQAAEDLGREANRHASLAHQALGDRGLPG